MKFTQINDILLIQEKRLKELNKLSDKELNDLAPQLEKYEEERKREYFKKFKGVE